MFKTDSAPNDPPLRVLVVDDDVDAAQSLCCLLETLGCTTAATHDGPDGLALAGSFEPELAIIDFEMPGMKGGEVMQHLRLQGVPSLALAVCVTGHNLPLDAGVSSNAGFDAYMTKPVRRDALASLIAQTRARARSAASAADQAPVLRPA